MTHHRVCLLSFCFLGSGCVLTLYQPMKGLARPVVLEPTTANFQDMRILVRCISDKADLPRGDATKLCQLLAKSFRAQGAICETVVPAGGGYQAPDFSTGEGIDLTVEVESKTDHESANQFSFVLSVVSFYLLPSVSEQSFTQKITVYGKDRSVLASDIFRSRFVTYEGISVWGINWLLDWLVREEEDKLSGDEPNKDFSRDFYRQTAQLAFNARVRSDLLGLTSTRSKPEPAADAGDPAD